MRRVLEPKKFDFAAKSFGLNQKLYFHIEANVEIGAETEITWGLSSVSTFWRQNRILGV